MATILYQRSSRRDDPASSIAEEVLGGIGDISAILSALAEPKKPPAKASVGLTKEEAEVPEPPPEKVVEESPEPKAMMSKRSLSREKPSGKVSTYAGGSAFMEGMLRRGWSVEEAAGAAGNAHVESGFRPGIKSSVPNEQSFGFLQWNGPRLRGLKNMAAATGRDWTDPEAQMDYIHAERTGESVKYGGADERAMYQKALGPGGTPEQIAERFGKYVERPLRLSDTVATRRAAAAKYAYIDDITDRLSGG